MNGSDVYLRVAVTDHALDEARLSVEVRNSSVGAVVVFSGTVRDHSPGKTGVTKLEYEAYAEHVESKLREVVAEAIDRWPVLGAVVEHRVGTLEVGDAAVIVAVSSAHRADAFDAARYIIDELKERVPIWKKEHHSGGAEWIEGA